MDTKPRRAETAAMDTRQKTLEELLAIARDITDRTLGATPDVVVTEVFRQLCYQSECSLAERMNELSRPPLH